MKTSPPKSNRKLGQQNQISLMHVFREAARKKDATSDGASYKEGEREINQRTIQRRHGADQGSLKAHLNEDLANLMHTIRLDAALDVSKHKHVAKSVLNFGMDDMANMSSNSENRGHLERRLRQALIDHEPRLIPDSIEVVMRQQDKDLSQKLAFDISADLAANPVDVPLEFVAEIDVGGGKVNLANLKVNR
ncbi:type VI secretion system baseplate subunit TssE [Litoreibacter janthinus]|uniref:Type VI secretion system protein ImpF n=1 Tax=Litoreibacter janthinus TaxID=670154 RepID=A0A1I6IE05_9RHOB|nr:type VI secretion system baseplate subunit TssE [Litoreibacter janthinus]SFR65007.1 type VI secretion system protein ImpF [Litoreibacter janthinus]